MSRPSRTPGICRIDQAHKYNHGFFVRLQRCGKIQSAFFTDINHGGKRRALAAAQAHYLKLQKKLGIPDRRSRRWRAEIVRRKGKSGIQGVQRVINRRVKPWRKYWRAIWSPIPYVTVVKQFSIRRYGEERAKQLAIRARRAGVRSMLPAD